MINAYLSAGQWTKQKPPLLPQSQKTVKIFTLQCTLLCQLHFIFPHARVGCILKSSIIIQYESGSECLYSWKPGEKQKGNRGGWFWFDLLWNASYSVNRFREEVSILRFKVVSCLGLSCGFERWSSLLIFVAVFCGAQSSSSLRVPLIVLILL